MALLRATRLSKEQIHLIFMIFFKFLIVIKA